MPNFRIWFSGLCHFVENEDPNARCRICVVIPQAAGDQDRNDHEVKVSYAKRVQRRGRRVIDHGDRIGDLLNRHRVTFEVTRSGDAKPLPPLEIPPGDEPFFFRLSEIAGIYADRDPSIVSSEAAESVAAQVLLEQGIFGFDERLSIVRPWEVNDLDGGKIKRNVADPIYVEITEVESVSVIITPMNGGDAFREELEQNAGDDFEIIVGARCDRMSEPDLEVREEPSRLVLVQVDHDFAFHYNLLHECSIGALNRHPVIQERMGSHASAFPIPESRMLELFVSPFLENALKDTESPDGSGANSDAEAAADPGSRLASDSSDKAAASLGVKAADSAEAPSVVGSLLRGGVSSLGAIKDAQWFDPLVDALKDIIRSSGATCDCLPCDGRVRVFSLDQHLPGNASEELGQQKTDY